MSSDIVSPKTRSRMMAGIGPSNTRPEVTLRRQLFARGLRFRLHRRDLPGNPDIVLPKYNVALFVHGCFWHRHEACRLTTVPKTNAAFWQDKFLKNVQRDRVAVEALLKLKWRVAVVWECSLKKGGLNPAELDLLTGWIESEAFDVSGSTTLQRFLVVPSAVSSSVPP